MKKTEVYVRHLLADHQDESMNKYQPLPAELKDEVSDAVREIFDYFGGGDLLKSSGDVYIKPNGIDGKPYCYSRLEVVESVIQYFKRIGARNIFLFENSTQSNYTRVVFEVTGYKNLCKRTGAIPIYLDEEDTELFEFHGKPSVNEDPDGYDLKTFHLPETVVKLIKEKDRHLYVNLPKLKTHSMGVVTLGVKNQWGFPRHIDRGYDHNYNLHSKLADVLEYIKPDFTLIDGIEGTIHGHYPPTALADDLVKKFKILIGGTNVVATDIVGARVFGKSLQDVPHLKVAVERGHGFGVRSIDDIKVIGDLTRFGQKYPHELVPIFHPDVNIVKGRDLLCPEGCRNNPLTLLQILYLDHDAKGGWDLVIGKGHDSGIINSLNGPVLICGHCAIEEVSDQLIARLGRKNVYLSGYCNDLAATASSMLRLTKVNVMELVDINPIKAVLILLKIMRHGSSSKVPSIFCNYIKKT